MKPVPKPREGRYYGMRIVNVEGANGTWLEGEEFAYPHGGFTRRCYAVFPDGQKRVVKCSIPDTYFSIPANGRMNGRRVKGYVTSSENGFEFRIHGFDHPATTAAAESLRKVGFKESDYPAK